jgi:hypothetical protein
LAKKNARKRNFAYFEHPDGSAPSMSPLHVAFAANSVELLQKNPKMIGPDLIVHWNRDHAAKWINAHANSLPHKGRGASGRADNFFVNGYFVMPHLQRMARGELPLPIPNTGPDGANVRQREQPRTGADGADATAARANAAEATGRAGADKADDNKLPDSAAATVRRREGARAGEDGADATRRGRHREGGHCR